MPACVGHCTFVVLGTSDGLRRPGARHAGARRFLVLLVGSVLVPDSDPPDDPVVVPIGPEIDLHSFQPREVVEVAVEYVTAAHAAGLREVRLIHGRGQGVQRALVQRALRDHPLVTAYWDDTASHLGATFARLAE